jgi:hypothetical protein
MEWTPAGVRHRCANGEIGLFEAKARRNPRIDSLSLSRSQRHESGEQRHSDDDQGCLPQWLASDERYIHRILQAKFAASFVLPTPLYFATCG